MKRGEVVRKPWPKLSETLAAVLDLKTCQHCGMTDEGNPDFLLSRWQECDERDNPNDVVVLLCKRCADQIIEPHPRLYANLHNWQPLPGSMACCDDCILRSGVTCTSPLLKSNGGKGLPLRFPKPGVMFVDGINNGRRWGGQMLNYYAAPSCDGKTTEDSNAS